MATDPDLIVLNLGGGVQSSVLALLLDRGDLRPRPELAIFADTGWDPPEVHSMVAWLSNRLSYPVEIVSGGNLKADLLAGVNSTRTGSGGFHAIPTFTRSTNPDGTERKGQTIRQCTNEYKIRPITRRIRDHLGLKPGEKAHPKHHIIQLLGISVDEWTRAKPAQEKWITRTYPLLDANLTRSVCQAWWSRNSAPDWPPLTRSACLGCPYKHAREWRQLTPTDIDQVEEVEQAIQTHDKHLHATAYLHPRRIPIRAAIRADHIEHDQQPTLFGDECEGVCGT